MSGAVATKNTSKMSINKAVEATTDLLGKKLEIKSLSWKEMTHKYLELNKKEENL